MHLNDFLICLPAIVLCEAMSLAIVVCDRFTLTGRHALSPQAAAADQELQSELRNLQRLGWRRPGAFARRLPRLAGAYYRFKAADLVGQLDLNVMGCLFMALFFELVVTFGRLLRITL